ncbi:energy-coupling factor transporter transmembrane component T [Gorillibacterium sp. sgz500922]|uniref:energy-coupling factor transporter transmembrane component T n=1 Tax=Gorillibacterium sp. sgz500922 TaxID=3446694 RepID=UPI003F67D330
MSETGGTPPDWLLVRESFEPASGKDRFLDRSLTGFLRAVSVFRHSPVRAPVSAIRPALRAAGALLLLILTALSRRFEFVAAVDGVLLALAARTWWACSALEASVPVRGMSRAAAFLRQAGRGLAACLVFPFLLAVMLVPAMLLGHVSSSLLLVLKTATSLVIVRTLVMSGGVVGLLRGLKALHLPDLVLWIAEMAVRSIVLLGEHGLALLQALKLRRVGGARGRQPFAGSSAGAYRPLTGILGSLFLRTIQVSEETAEAMECRGFVGEYRTAPSAGRFSAAEWRFLGLSLLLAACFFAG